MSGAKRTYLYTFTLLALFCVARASAQQTQVSWEEILASQLSYARRLKSISMEYSYSNEPTEFYVGPEPYPYTVVLRYEMEGLKFRQESHLEGTVFSPEHVNPTGPSMRLYDMKHYQNFNTETADLTLKETPNDSSYPRPPQLPGVQVNLSTLSFYHDPINEDSVATTFNQAFLSTSS